MTVFFDKISGQIVIYIDKFKDFLKIKKDDYTKDILENYKNGMEVGVELGYSKGKNDENKRIKKLSFWRRLFKRF